MSDKIKRLLNDRIEDLKGKICEEKVCIYEDSIRKFGYQLEAFGETLLDMAGEATKRLAFSFENNGLASDITYMQTLINLAIEKVKEFYSKHSELNILCGISLDALLSWLCLSISGQVSHAPQTIMQTLGRIMSIFTAFFFINEKIEIPEWKMNTCSLILPVIIKNFKRCVNSWQTSEPLYQYLVACSFRFFDTLKEIFGTCYCSLLATGNEEILLNINRLGVLVFSGLEEGSRIILTKVLDIFCPFNCLKCCNRHEMTCTNAWNEKFQPSYVEILEEKIRLHCNTETIIDAIQCLGLSIKTIAGLVSAIPPCHEEMTIALGEYAIGMASAFSKDFRKRKNVLSLKRLSAAKIVLLKTDSPNGAQFSQISNLTVQRFVETEEGIHQLVKAMKSWFCDRPGFPFTDITSNSLVPLLTHCTWEAQSFHISCLIEEYLSNTPKVEYKPLQKLLLSLHEVSFMETGNDDWWLTFISKIKTQFSKKRRLPKTIDSLNEQLNKRTRTSAHVIAGIFENTT
eukprot:Nk52_evm18s229 gene=Nk52_evmTU18s229